MYKSVWDFNIALGEAIAKENKHLNVKVVEMTNLVNRKKIEREKKMNNFWLEKKELKEEKAERDASLASFMSSLKTAIENLKKNPVEVFYLGESVGKTTNVCFFNDRVEAEVEVSKEVMDKIQQPKQLELNLDLENFQQALERVEAEGWVLDV